jgi:hypothetical protein
MVRACCRNDSAAAFMVFFFVFGFQILANIYFALGFFGTGAWCVLVMTSSAQGRRCLVDTA